VTSAPGVECSSGTPDRVRLLVADWTRLVRSQPGRHRLPRHCQLHRYRDGYTCCADPRPTRRPRTRMGVRPRRRRQRRRLARRTATVRSRNGRHRLTVILFGTKPLPRDRPEVPAIIGTSAVRRQGLEPRTRGLRDAPWAVRSDPLSAIPAAQMAGAFRTSPSAYGRIRWGGCRRGCHQRSPGESAVEDYRQRGVDELALKGCGWPPGCGLVIPRACRPSGWRRRGRVRARRVCRSLA
jgi:hypothetical protein